MTHQPEKIKKMTRVEKNLKDAAPPPLPFAKHIKTSDHVVDEKKLNRITHKEGQLTVEEASLLIADLNRKQEDIKHKLDEMFQQRGITPDYLKLYLSNPNNFTAEEWKNLQSHRQTLVNSLPFTEDLQDKTLAPYLSPDSTQSPDEAKKVASKDRHYKTAGAYRRRWLPMR